ncbi:MAG: CARDB domain-containing protein, partial [bacterium]
MHPHKNILSVITILALVFLELIPLGSAIAQPIQKDALKRSDSTTTSTDWSTVNFDQEIILPEDLEEFNRKVDELKNEGREDEIVNLSPQKRKMNDDYVLDYFNVPTEIRQNIQKDESSTVETPLKKELLEDPNNIIDLSTAPKLNIKRTEKAPELLKTIQPVITIQKREPTQSRPLIDKVLGILGSLFRTQTAYADFAVPLMQYYDGIGENTMDSALYYLSSIQNPDGSFGEYNQYEFTAEIVLLLSSFNKTDNDQFYAAIQYLTATEPQNNREKAMKARLMAGLGEPYQNYLDELVSAQNTDGGFGLENNYNSDVLTTLETALALYAADYSLQDALPAALYFVMTQISANGSMYYTSNSDPGYYLINVAAQSLYPFRTMTIAGDGGPSIVVQDKINALLSFLDANYDDTIDEAMALRTFRIYETQPDDQESLRESVTEKQYYDGSFGNSLYTTIEAMKALSQPDLVLTNLQSTGSLVNKSAASFALTVKNIGYGTSDAAYIHNFIDNFDIENTIDLSAQNVTLAPGEEVTINITYPDTGSFIGDTEFKFYIEGENESDYTNNWLSENFTFASAADGSPALPMYFIAQKHSIKGFPALNIRWPQKTDPNRENYIVMIREKGTSTWNYYGIADSLNGAFLYRIFEEGHTYEVTAGVLHHDLQTVTYFSDIDEVQMSSDSNLYTGNVIGYATVDNENLPDERTWGFGMSDTTDENGIFTYENAPNGSTAAGVDTPYYEKIQNKFKIGVGQTTENIRLFTKLIPDAEAPVIDHLEIRWKPDFVVRNQDEAQLYAYGSDNVALKNADFYYWDPDEAFWLYLGTESFEGQNNVLMPWYISENLLGSGYKIKTVFWDYQGNKSTPVEWGPFQITDGTAPDFEISSPNGGEEWPLGSEQTITWEDESVNGVSDVDLHLVYPHSAILIKSSTNNTGSYAWTVPNSYEYVGDNVKIRVIGEEGVTHLESEDESDGYFSIVDNSPLPDSPWGDPKTLSDMFDYDPAGGTIAMAELEYDKNGNAHIIYNYIHDQYGSPRILT